MGTTFDHIGVTVSDIEKTSEFYIKYFGFEKDYEYRFDEEFFKKRHAQFRQPAGVTCRVQMMRAPDGVLLALFQFSNTEAGEACWPRTGYNHICLRVDGLPALCERMVADGVEILMPPEIRTRKDGHWIYLKDPDGNFIELWD